MSHRAGVAVAQQSLARLWDSVSLIKARNGGFAGLVLRVFSTGWSDSPGPHNHKNVILPKSPSSWSVKMCVLVAQKWF